MSIKFDGTGNSTLRVADNPLLTYPNGDWTVAAVIVFDGQITGGTQYIVSNAGFQNPGSVNFVFGGGGPAQLQAYIDTSGSLLPTLQFNPQVVAGAGYIVVIQRNAGQVYIKRCPLLATNPVDGSAVVTSPNSAPCAVALDGPNGLVIGDRTNDRRLDQSMARVFRVDSALTDLEIAKLAYGMEITDLGKTPVWYFRMNDATDYADRGPNTFTTTPGGTPTTGTNLNFAYAPAAATAPTVASPTITGTPQVGTPIGYTPGAVTGNPTPTVTQQWLLDGVAISGATGTTYTPIAADVGKSLTVKQIATNTQGTANAISGGKAVTAAPVAPVAPTITSAPAINGTPQVGVAIGYTPGAVTGTAPITTTQQWQIAGVDVAGATGATYTPAAGDIGKALTVKQTAANGTAPNATSTSPGVNVAAAPAVSPTIVVTPPVAESIYQRVAGAATVPFSGTYGGAQPASIEYQLYDPDGSTVRKAWSSIGAAIAGNGTWTAAPSIPQGAKKYKVAVRSKDSGGNVLVTSAVHANRFGVGDIIGYVGSSAVGAWNNQAYETPGTPDNDRISRVFGNVTDGPQWGTDTFYRHGTRMIEQVAIRTGVATASLHYGVVGATLGNWIDTNYSGWKDFANAVQVAALNKLAGVFISVGSNDATGTTVTSKAVHLSRLVTLFANLRALTGNSSMPCLVSGYNRRTTGYEANQTLAEFAMRSEWVRMAENEAGDLPNIYHTQNLDLALYDGVHLDAYATITSTTRIAYVWGEAVMTGVYHRGPKLTAFTATGATVTAALQLRGGDTDFTPTSGITGFTITDASGTPAIVSAVHTDATHITVTCDRPLVAPVVTKYLGGNAPDIGTPVYGNSTQPLPMVMESELVTAASTAPATVSGVTVTPATATVQGGAVQQFAATAVGTNNPPQTFTWSRVPAVGALTASGLYTAPAAASSTQTITVTATSTQDPTKSGTATVTVPAAVAPPVVDPTPTVTSVTVTPSAVTLGGGAVQQFAATAVGANNPPQTFTWARAPAVGALTASGQFTAPVAAASAQTITVTATSTQDPTKSGTATVTVPALAVTPPAPTSPENPGFIRSQTRTIKVKAAPLTFEGGAFWDLSDPKHPVGTIDPDATIDISFDWAEVLADISDAIALVQFDIDGLTSVGGYFAAGYATIFVKAPTDQPRITCRITTSSTPARVEDRTVFLKIEDE